jgi:Uma2 family endonuclease
MPIDAITQTVTAAELFQYPLDGYRYELVEGNLRMMSPAGGRHGRLAYKLSLILGKHVETYQLGVVFAAETGFRIATEPDTVLAPDVAFVKQSRYVAYENETGYLPLAPDLVVEVLSPSDRFSRVEAKALAWLDAGCTLVLIVEPETETAHCYRSRSQIQIFEKGESLDCSDAVSGWTLNVADIFKH